MSNIQQESTVIDEEVTIVKGKQFDLQDRFIEYAVRIIRLAEAIPENKAGRHICSQVLRSGTSPAPNYGEAQSAESKADFIHKLKIALKELRETEIWLKIIIRAELIKPSEQLSSLLKETDELIAILFKSVETAKRNKEAV
jgi:four helix bundle protein